MGKKITTDKVLHQILRGAVGMYLFNRAYSAIATRRSKLEVSGGQFFNWNGTKVFYRTKGQGSPVILVHELHPASSGFEWNYIEEELSKHFTLYMIDLPGCGRSDKPDILFTSFMYVKLLRDFIDEMELDHPYLVTSNSSASIGLMLDVDAPNLISAMVMINPTAPEILAEAPTPITRMGKRFLDLPLIGPFIYNIYISKSRIDLSFSEQYLYNPFHDNDELVNAFFESAHLGEGNGNHFAASYVGRFLNVNVDKVSPKVTTPVRIIEGKNSPGAEEAVRSWKKLNPNFDVVEINHTRQLPHIEEPALVSSKILSFFER